MKTFMSKAERDARAQEIRIAAAEAEKVWESPLLQKALSELEDEALEILDHKVGIFGEKVRKQQEQAIMFRQVTKRFTKKLKKAIEAAALLDSQS